jgi:hypothetical protein
MNIQKTIKRLVKKREWQPKQDLVYKSWFRGSSHIGKNAVVKIIYKDTEYKDGTFKVTNDKCELRIGEPKWNFGLERGSVKLLNSRRLITSVKNVEFTKKINEIDTIISYGQNGYRGKEIVYTVKILNPQDVEETLIF